MVVGRAELCKSRARVARSLLRQLGRRANIAHGLWVRCGLIA
jgi:hypothetical protein